MIGRPVGGAARKRVAAAALAAGLAGLGLLWLAPGWGFGSTAPNRWLAVERRDLVLGIATEGELRAVDSALIGPPQLRRVWNFQIAMIAPEGSEVEAGQPVLGFDATELNQRLRQSMAEADSAEKGLELVGGIGIMNIMLASVLERTREIGVRRAVGARRTDILFQFIIESFALAAIGGVAGIVMGIVIARLVAASAGWTTIIQLWSVLLATGVAVSVGLASGVYPAIRAADLDPIDALRWE